MAIPSIRERFNQSADSAGGDSAMRSALNRALSSKNPTKAQQKAIDTANAADTTMASEGLQDPYQRLIDNSDYAEDVGEYASGESQAFFEGQNTDLAGMSDSDIKALADREKNAEAIRKARAHSEGRLYAKPGQIVMFDPLTKREVVADMPGTRVYSEEYEKMQGALGAMRILNSIQNDIDNIGPSGTDMYGTRAIRINANRNKLFSEIFRSRGFGTPQTAEIELVEKGLLDSADGWLNVVGALQSGITLGGAIIEPPIKAEIKQGYQAVQEEMQQSLTNKLLANPLLIDAMTDGDVGQLHPESDLFQMLVKLRGM
tara:strand:+ start:160 stop:1107 length:948 start_codon:yes stop_codon:yes gene_type:complete